MSVQKLKALARKHWAEWLPQKVKELKAEGKLNEALQGAANLAQTEIEHLMSKRHYSEQEAREVALPKFILLPPEPGAVEDDAEAEELAQMESDYQKNVAPYLNSKTDQKSTQSPQSRPTSDLAKPPLLSNDEVLSTPLRDWATEEEDAALKNWPAPKTKV